MSITQLNIILFKPFFQYIIKMLPDKIQHLPSRLQDDPRKERNHMNYINTSNIILPKELTANDPLTADIREAYDGIINEHGDPFGSVIVKDGKIVQRP